MSNMKVWPVSNSYFKEVPVEGAGSFSEFRIDRIHCGVDIYAPTESDVVSIDGGRVLEIGEFTSPRENSYWNTSFYILLLSESGVYIKYCELGEVLVIENQLIKGGQLIGRLGELLNFNEIISESPIYIKQFKEKEICSMLHIEMYSKRPAISKYYSGGNWFSEEMPDNIIDPTDLLNYL